MVTDALKFIVLPPFFLARAELARRLERIMLIESEEGKLVDTNLVVLAIPAKWQEHNDRSNEAVVRLATGMMEARMLDLDALRTMAREAMLETKQKRLRQPL